jgi:hypothetical protein
MCEVCGGRASNVYRNVSMLCVSSRDRRINFIVSVEESEYLACHNAIRQLEAINIVQQID